jgi:O-antigen/teichoic acid export membrane protein
MKGPTRFYSSLGLLVLLNAIVKPLWIFAIDRQVQNTVGFETYGVYFSLFNLSVVFSFLADWGFTVFLNRQLAAEGNTFINSTGNFLLLKLLLAFIYIVVVFVAAWFSGVKRWNIVFFVALIQVLSSLFVFFRAVITSQQWFRSDAWLSIVDKALMILSCGFFIYFPFLFGPITIDRFLFLQVLCLAIAIGSTVIFLVRKKFHFRINKNLLPDKKLFRQVLPFTIIILLMSVHSRLDAFLLERININGAYEAGIYAASYRLLDAVNMGGTLVASFALPYIARQWSNREDISGIILNCRHLLLMIIITIICSSVFLASWIQQILYHHNDRYAAEVLQWCLPSLIGYSLAQVYGTVLTATGRVVQFCYINLFSAGINIGLNFLLIPSRGAMGCCIAALCSQLFCGIVAMLYVKQKLMVSLHLRSLLIYIFTAVLLGGFFYYFRDWPLSKWMLIGVAGMITITIMLSTKLTGMASWVRTLLKRNS